MSRITDTWEIGLRQKKQKYPSDDKTHADSALIRPLCKAIVKGLLDRLFGSLA